MTAYYNEFDPKAAAWLRELIKHGHIADGVVDERSIEDVAPSDLAGFTQCHFFAGIGIWSYALRRAGWADNRPVWTGSCPCQPFSAAGKGAGFADERHLWPAFHHLIRECAPESVYGEQVASKDGLNWFDLVYADLEGSGYAVGAADLCAAGFGAPHIRQRLWWTATRLANTEYDDGRSDIARRGSDRGTIDGGCGGPVRVDNTTSARHIGSIRDTEANSRFEAWLRVSGAGFKTGIMEHATSDGREQWRGITSGCGNGGLVNTGSAGCERHGQSGNINVPARWPIAGRHGATAGVDGGMADADRDGCGTGNQLRSDGQEHDVEHGGGAVRPGPVNGAWSNTDWLFCRDGKWRPVESGTFPLAHGVAERVGLLRGYGNAIVAQVAEGFIRATM